MPASKPVQAESAHLFFIPGYVGNTMNRNRLDLIVPCNRETTVIFKIGVHVAEQLGSSEVARHKEVHRGMCAWHMQGKELS